MTRRQVYEIAFLGKCPIKLLKLNPTKYNCYMNKQYCCDEVCIYILFEELAKQKDNFGLINK